MAIETITNSTALEILSLLRASGIAGFERLPIQPPTSWEMTEEKARFYLLRLCIIGGQRDSIDSSDIKIINDALQRKGITKRLSEKDTLSLAGEFQRKFGVSYPIHLSNGKIWDPKKIRTPSAAETQQLTQALQNNSIDSLSHVITIPQVPDFEKQDASIRKTDIILYFLQSSHLAQRNGEAISWIQPEDVTSIQADFHHHASQSAGFQADGKTVIYRIIYKVKDSKEEKFVEVEVKPFGFYKEDQNANGYLKTLAKKTAELIQPKLKL